MTSTKSEPFTEVRAAASSWVGWSTPISWTLEPAKSYGLVGPSGSGKSTLLRWLAGWERPPRGKILWKGTPVGADWTTSRKARAQFVQLLPANVETSLDPLMSVQAQMKEPLTIYDREAEAAGWLERFRFPRNLLGHKPGDLSGGQRQRLALARALCLKPALLLLDEPFAQLDRALVDELRELIDEDARDRGTTVVWVSHRPRHLPASISESLRLAADGAWSSVG